MPEISSFYGIAIYMYMSEHNPPHFHVKYQGYEAIRAYGQLGAIGTLGSSSKDYSVVIKHLIL